MANAVSRRGVRADAPVNEENAAREIAEIRTDWPAALSLRPGSRLTLFKASMVPRRSAVPLLVLLALAAVVISCVRLPLVRTTGYGAMVREYAQATTVLPNSDEPEGLKWNAEVPLSSGAKVRIQAPGHMGVVRVQYPDEADTACSSGSKRSTS